MTHAVAVAAGAVAFSQHRQPDRLVRKGEKEFIIASRAKGKRRKEEI